MIGFRRSQFVVKILYRCQHFFNLAKDKKITWMKDKRAPRTAHSLSHTHTYATLGPRPKDGEQATTSFEPK